MSASRVAEIRGVQRGRAPWPGSGVSPRFNPLWGEGARRGGILVSVRGSPRITGRAEGQSPVGGVWGCPRVHSSFGGVASRGREITGSAEGQSPSGGGLGVSPRFNPLWGGRGVGRATVPPHVATPHSRGVEKGSGTRAIIRNGKRLARALSFCLSPAQTPSCAGPLYLAGAIYARLIPSPS